MMILFYSTTLLVYLSIHFLDAIHEPFALGFDSLIH